MAPKATKAPVTYNWVPSTVTWSKLSEFLKSGHLPKKEIMSYRALDPSEEKPHPKEAYADEGQKCGADEIDPESTNEQAHEQKCHSSVAVTKGKHSNGVEADSTSGRWG